MGIYHVPLPAEYFSACSSCLDCYVWGGLSVSVSLCQFVVLPHCGDSSLWVGLKPCQGFLVRETCVGFLVGGADLFSLECKEVSSSEFLAIYGFGVTLGSLYIETQGYVPALLENLYGISCSGTCWLLGGALFQCMYGSFLMSSY